MIDGILLSVVGKNITAIIHDLQEHYKNIIIHNWQEH
jgi:hypothetical protein